MGLFRNRTQKELHKSAKNWLDISDEETPEKDLAFIKSIIF